MASPLTVRPLAEDDIDALLSFAASYYGPAAHQARRSRFDWLYRSNPLAAGPWRDVMVAVTANSKVVGSLWKTRLLWSFQGEHVTVPSFHDLAIVPEHRQGHGLKLILAALAGEQRAALLGLSPQSDGIFARMNCPLVPMAKFQKVLSYPRTLLGVLRLSRPRRRDVLQYLDVNRQVLVTAQPGDELLHAALTIPESGDCHLCWNPDTYRWRFFHPLGPLHALVLVGDSHSPRGRAVFSYGQRRGAVIARLVDLAVIDPRCLTETLDAAETAMRAFGVAFATAATTSEAASDHLLHRGWSVQQGVTSRFFLRHKGTMPDTEIWGGSYDYGYDAN